MKRETILKIILVLIMGVVLFARPINVLATDLQDFLEDQGSLDDLQPDTPTTPTTPTTPSTETTTPNTNEKEELPKAGIAEDTMMVVSIMVLGATAIFALKKVNEYKNI